MQVSKGKPLDWVSGQPVTDEHGRLQVTVRNSLSFLSCTSLVLQSNVLLPTTCSCFQIIKNDDLEELQELGSGTFGTVYHGKWRGSDVAIKRINDRCFAGKPSEQEKMV